MSFYAIHVSQLSFLIKYLRLQKYQILQFVFLFEPVKFDFLDHSSCHTSNNSSFLACFLAKSSTLFCFLYFTPNRIWSTNYSALVLTQICLFSTDTLNWKTGEFGMVFFTQIGHFSSDTLNWKTGEFRMFFFYTNRPLFCSQFGSFITAEKDPVDQFNICSGQMSYWLTYKTNYLPISIHPSTFFL
jgi:hypothetical protein